MKVLVTGGAGFIGSHVVDALVAAGAQVHAVDNLSRGRVDNLAGALAGGAQMHAADVTDELAIARLTAAVQPDVVLHLAAHIDARRSVDEPAFDARVNVAGTAAILEAARRAGARRVVLASTAAVYGPRQDPHGESGVVAIFTGAAADGRAVTIHGDGRQTRDYVHVEDVAAAFLLATASTVTGVLNIATGRETSVLELAAAIGIDVLHGPPRAGEIERSCLDPGAAARAIGWQARVPISAGLTGLRPPVAA